MNRRLIHFLLLPALLCASLAAAAGPSPEAADNAGCEGLLAVVRRSLEEEIVSACPAAAPASISAPAPACAAHQEPLRAIVDFIGQRRAADADECDTLLEVNKRLRSLPPKI